MHATQKIYQQTWHKVRQQLPFTTHFNSRYNHHTHIETQISSLTNTIFLTHKRHSTLDLMYAFIIQLILISNLAYLVSFSFYVIGNTLLFIFLKRYLTNRKNYFYVKSFNLFSQELHKDLNIEILFLLCLGHFFMHHSFLFLANFLRYLYLTLLLRVI